MFVESDRVQIRNYLGFGALFLQADPTLENAITAIQAVVDGGTRPDNSSELFCKTLITSLTTVDSLIDSLDAQKGAQQLDKGDLVLNQVREEARLRRKGRMLVGRLARLLATRPVSDVFSMVSTRETPNAFEDAFHRAGTRW